MPSVQIYLTVLGEMDSEMSELGTTTLLLFRLMFAQVGRGDGVALLAAQDLHNCGCTGPSDALS